MTSQRHHYDNCFNLLFLNYPRPNHAGTIRVLTDDENGNSHFEDVSKEIFEVSFEWSRVMLIIKSYLGSWPSSVISIEYPLIVKKNLRVKKSNTMVELFEYIFLFSSLV